MVRRARSARSRVGPSGSPSGAVAQPGCMRGGRILNRISTPVGRVLRTTALTGAFASHSPFTRRPVRRAPE